MIFMIQSIINNEMLSIIHDTLHSDENKGSAAKKRGSGGRRSVHGDRAGEDIKKNNRMLKKQETKRL